MILRGLNIVIISPESWGTSKLSKHHYAEELVRMGNEVYFLNPPGNRKSQNKLYKGLTIVDYRQPRGLNRLPEFMRDIIYNRIFLRIFRGISMENTIVWSFDPYRFNNLGQYGGKYSIYHAVDLHSTWMEDRIARSADLVIANNPAIRDRIMRKTGVEPVIINHGLARHFVEYANQANNHNKIGDRRIKVGMIGNLNNRFIDYKTILKVVVSNTDCDFYFIGPYKKSNISLKTTNKDQIELLKTLPNTVLEGELPSIDLPGRMQSFDLLWMCYDSDSYPEELANSHKFLEYLSSGKPIVTNRLVYYEGIGLAVEMARTNEEMPNLIQNVISSISNHMTEDRVRKRKDFALMYTYQSNIEKIQSILQSIY